MMDGFVRKWFGKTLNGWIHEEDLDLPLLHHLKRFSQRYKQHNQNTVIRILGFPWGILGNLRKYHFPRYSRNAGEACVGFMLMLMDCQ